MAETELAPKQQNMEDVTDYEQWSADDVANYFEAKGFPPDYRHVFIDNELTGERIVLLTLEDVPDLEFTKVGHRVGLLKTLRELKTKATLQLRRQELERQEQAYNGCWLGEKFFTLCGICPRDPDQYILKAGKLVIKGYELTRICGSFKCTCLGGSWTNDNISLDRIKDVDTVTTKSGLCCWKVEKTTVLLAVAAGADAESEEARVVQKELFVEASVGEKFADAILFQSEEYVMKKRNAMM